MAEVESDGAVMNQNFASILWVGAAFAGFLVWWPIGACFLGAILITALNQQATGYRLPPPEEPTRHVTSLPPLYYDVSGRPMKHVQGEVLPPATTRRITRQ